MWFCKLFVDQRQPNDLLLKITRYWPERQQITIYSVNSWQLAGWAEYLEILGYLTEGRESWKVEKNSTFSILFP